MDFTIQHYPCSLCKKDAAKPLVKKQGFSIVRCSSCGFVYVNPRVQNEELSEIYRHNYFKNKDYGYMGYEQEKRLRVKNFEKWLYTAEQFVKAGKRIHALDIGSAAGYCLTVMKEKGWDAEGLELDSEMCAKSTEDGLTVSQTELGNFETAKKFDVITLFDVIEHIPGIDMAFKKLDQLLEQDGIVIMVTPDHNSRQRRLFGKKWFQYKPIEHIQYFTGETLGVFAKRNGLQVVYQQSCGQYADTQFIVNRLNYYHFPFISRVAGKFFSVFGLGNKCFYLGTGSLFVVLKKI